MQMVILISAIALAVLGIVGCIVPILPGPLLALAGTLLLLCGQSAPTATMLVVLSIACAAVLLLDTFLPPIVSRKFGGSKSGMWGSLVGSIVGTALFPIGIIIGAFLGAALFEKAFTKMPWREAIIAGAGAFTGFLLGTAAKLAFCLYCLIVIWRTQA